MKKDQTPRNYNVIWALAGAYLIYLGAKLFLDSVRGVNTTRPWLGFAAGIPFAIIGALLLLREWRLYSGAKQSADELAALAEEAADSETEEEAGQTDETEEAHTTDRTEETT